MEDYPVCGIVFGCVSAGVRDARIALLGGGCPIVRKQGKHGCRNAIFNSKRTDSPTTVCSGIVAEPPGACPRPALPDGGTTRASPCLRPHVMRECVHACVCSLSRTRVCGRCAVLRRSAESVLWLFPLHLRDFACEKVLALVLKENVAVRGWKRYSRGITLWDNACCCSKRRGYYPLR